MQKWVFTCLRCLSLYWNLPYKCCQMNVKCGTEVLPSYTTTYTVTQSSRYLRNPQNASKYEKNIVLYCLFCCLHSPNLPSDCGICSMDWAGLFFSQCFSFAAEPKVLGRQPQGKPGCLGTRMPLYSYSYVPSCIEVTICLCTYICLNIIKHMYIDGWIDVGAHVCQLRPIGTNRISLWTGWVMRKIMIINNNIFNKIFLWPDFSVLPITWAIFSASEPLCFQRDLKHFFPILPSYNEAVAWNHGQVANQICSNLVVYIVWGSSCCWNSIWVSLVSYTNTLVYNVT